MTTEPEAGGPALEVIPSGVPGRTKAERVQAMFARLVPRYDLMNALMTGGLDRRWRSVAAHAAAPSGATVLDVGTGTGDLALALGRAGAARVIGTDFCPEMLVVARDKARRHALGVPIVFVAGDALQLPFPDQTFDRVTSAFLLRNVASLPRALSEMTRVLKPGGRLVCLEITHPPSGLAPVFQLYFRRIVPLIGALVTGQGEAYQYLPASLGPLPDAKALARLFEAAGLAEVSYRRLGLGTVALHWGCRPEEPGPPGHAESDRSPAADSRSALRHLAQSTGPHVVDESVHRDVPRDER